MKHALVTGGAGFIGSHLTEALLAAGCRVTVVDDESTGTADNLSAVVEHPHLYFVHGSVGDQALMAGLLSDVDEIYHLAAAVGVALVARDPIDSIRRNIGPVESLLEQLRQIGAGGACQTRLFLASSSEVYGKNPKPTWTEEDDLVLGPTSRPRWSYGASKAIDEFLALAYWRQHQLPVVVGRLFNVVGPRQTGAYGMVLPRFVEAAVRGDPITVHDDGQQVRCFAHVSDVVHAIMALVSSPHAAGQVFNIGSDNPVSILTLAEKVAAAVDRPVEIRFQSYGDAYGRDFEDIRRRVPDLSRLRATIGFRPRFDLDAIITELVRRAERSRDLANG